MPQTYHSQILDHLGLVAGMFEELGIAEVIDKATKQDPDMRIVTAGHAVKAMVLNGAGFVNQQLYLVPHFFHNTPTYSVPLHYETTIFTSSSHHAFFRPDQARGLFPRQGPPAILGRTLQGDLVPAAYRCGVVRRANHIGQLHERVLHPKDTVTNRLDPPGIEA